MKKKIPRTDADADWDKKVGATIKFIRMRDARQNQAVFAKRMGVSRSHLSNIETGRTPLTVSVGWQMCREFDLNPTWILAAGNGIQPNVFPKDIPARQLEIILSHLNATGSAPLRAIWPSLAHLTSEDALEEKEELTTKVKSLTTDDVKPVLPKLIQRLNLLTRERGQKSELATWLGVHRQCVTDWLSGKQEPGGEITLRLLSWAEQKENQKQKGTGPVDAKPMPRPGKTKDNTNEIHHNPSPP